MAASATRETTGRLGHHRHLLTGSATLLTGAAVQALTGAVFWLVAARLDTTDDVGRATALFTSVLFIAYLAGLGLQVSLARYAPGRDHDSHAVFSWAVVATVAAGTVASIGYLVVVGSEATTALRDWHPVGGPLLFVAGGVGAGLTLIVDVRWMALRRWSLVLARIVVVGLLRFPLLAVPAGRHQTVHLFAVATLPLLATGAVGVLTMPRVSGDRHRLAPAPTTSRAAVRYSMVNYVSTLAYQAPQFVLPVIVLLSVDPDANASFYVAWGITGIVFYVPTAMGQALLAEGGKDGSPLHAQVRLVLAATTGLMTAGAVICALGRDVVTTVYGDDYRDAARILPVLVAAGIPWAVTSVLLTEARVRHRHLATVTITGALTIFILIPALVLVPDDGLDGATRAFLLGNVAAALVASAIRLRDRGRVEVVEVGHDPVIADLTLHP